MVDETSSFQDEQEIMDHISFCEYNFDGWGREGSLRAFRPERHATQSFYFPEFEDCKDSNWMWHIICSLWCFVILPQRQCPKCPSSAWNQSTRNLYIPEWTWDCELHFLLSICLPLMDWEGGGVFVPSGKIELQLHPSISLNQHIGRSSKWKWKEFGFLVIY